MTKIYFSINDLTWAIGKASVMNVHISLTFMAINVVLVFTCDISTLPGEGTKQAKISEGEETSAKAQELK